MGRLALSRAYLCGPMDRDRNGGKLWRYELRPWLKQRKIFYIDPYDKPVKDILEEEREDDEVFKKRVSAIKSGNTKLAHDLCKPMVHIDLRCVDIADFIICYLDLDKTPIGTIDEITTATNQRKPVVLNCPQGVKNIPPWLYGRLKQELFFDNWDDVKEYIRHIDEDENIDTLNNRWKFFDWERLYKEINI